MNLIKAVPELISTILKYIALAIDWIGNIVIDPLKGKRDIIAYFDEIKSGLKSVSEMYHEDHKKALENFLGGFLFYITHHSIEMLSQLILVFVGGGYVFHAIGDAAESSFKAFGITEAGSGAFKSSLIAFLWFLHCIDDPLALFPTIMNPVIQASNLQVKINAQIGSTPALPDIQQQVFGIQNKTFDQMNVTERVTAFDNFKSFICDKSPNGTFFVPTSQISSKLNSTSNPLTEVNIDCKKLKKK